MSGDADFVPDDTARDPLLTDASPVLPWPLIDANIVPVTTPSSSAAPWTPTAPTPIVATDAAAQAPIQVGELLPVDAARPVSAEVGRDANVSSLDGVVTTRDAASAPMSSTPGSSTSDAGAPSATKPVSSTPASSTPSADAGSSPAGAAAQCRPQTCTNYCGLAARCCNVRGECACMSLLRTCTLPSLRF